MVVSHVQTSRLSRVYVYMDQGDIILSSLVFVAWFVVLVLYVGL